MVSDTVTRPGIPGSGIVGRPMGIGRPRSDTGAGGSAWLGLARSGATLAGALSPTSGMRLAWRELSHKLAAYDRFRAAGGMVARGAAEAPLAEAVRAALDLEPGVAPWVVEGLAFARAEAAWAAFERGGPGGFLSGPDAAGIPPAALLPLHTGLGMSLARRALDGLGSRPDDAELGRALARFTALCRAHARPEYLEAALEAVGLVARTLHPHLLERLAGAAGEVASEEGLEELLRHGAGRGLYFSPAHVLPVLDPAVRALRAAWREGDDDARRNGVAGVAWALTLVNLHDPEVVAGVLEGAEAAGIDRSAFAHGVASAVTLRTDVVGRDPDLDAFLAHRPACGGCHRADLWERWVRRPAEEAAARAHAELRRRGALGTIFRVSGGGASHD